jgi:hypothetical protein
VIICLSLQAAALVVVDNEGIYHRYPYDSFFRIQGRDFVTEREVDREIVLTTWKGIRFDTWLKEQRLGDFHRIRFVSSDRYEVVFNHAEWDTLTAWLAHSEEGTVFPNEQLRLIFPHLRSQFWVRDLVEVHLENHKEIPIPGRFFAMRSFFAEQELLKDPKPFVRMQGYRFDDFLDDLSDKPIKDIVLYSKDGLIQNLSYPSQLAGAVLELSPEGSFNLKSPQIPGGMWMKNIVYLQCDDLALIDLRYIAGIIPIAKSLQWKLGPSTQVILNYPDRSETEHFGDAIGEPMIFDGIRDFQLVP